MVFRRRTALARKTGGKRKFARRVAPKRRVGAHKSMVKLIKSVIHKQAENKVVSYTANTAIYNYNSPTGFNANNIIPLTHLLLAPRYSFCSVLARPSTGSTQTGNA